jgi:hypothetical protein
MVPSTPPPVAILGVSWCETCKSGPLCITNRMCGGDVRPTPNQLPSTGNGTLILTVENVGCPAPASVWFSWGRAFPVRRSVSVGALTYLELTSPEAPQPGDFLIMVSEAVLSVTFANPDITITCLGRGCNAAATQGVPFTVVITKMPVTSASQLEVTIADTRATFTLVSSDDATTVLLITPPACTNCRYSSRSV